MTLLDISLKAHSNGYTVAVEDFGDEAGPAIPALKLTVEDNDDFSVLVEVRGPYAVIFADWHYELNQGNRALLEKLQDVVDVDKTLVVDCCDVSHLLFRGEDWYEIDPEELWRRVSRYNYEDTLSSYLKLKLP